MSDNCSVNAQPEYEDITELKKTVLFQTQPLKWKAKSMNSCVKDRIKPFQVMSSDICDFGDENLSRQLIKLRLIKYL